MQRLAQFVDQFGLKKPSQIASSMGVGEQVITNWSARGLSQEGALIAQEKYGCSAVWLLKGVGSTRAPTVVEGPGGAAVGADGQSLAWLLQSIPPERRQSAYVAVTEILIRYLNGVDSAQATALQAPGLNGANKF